MMPAPSAETSAGWSVWEFACLILLVVSFAFIQVLVAGAALVHAIPAYAGIAVAAVLSLFSLGRSTPSVSKACLIATLLFMGYVLGRIFWSPVEYLARKDLFMAIAALIVYLLTAFCITKRQQRIWVVLALMVLALGHVALGFIQFKNGDNFMPIPFLQRADYERRASGFYICPNHLAGFLEVVLMLGLSLTLWSRLALWLKLLLGYLCLMVLAGLIMTGSRGGYLSTGFGLFVFMALSVIAVRRRAVVRLWRFYLIGLVAILIAVGTAGMLIKKNDYLRERAASTYEPKNMRLLLWKGALQQFQMQPWFGTGSRTYLYYGRFFRVAEVDKDPEYTHNDYLQFLAEFGLVGIAGLLLFLPVHLWNGGKSFSRLTQKKDAAPLTSDFLALNIGALSALSTYLIHSIFDFNLHIPANALLLAFVFGMLATRIRDVRNAQPAAKKNLLLQRSGKLALPALGIWLIVIAVPTLPAEYYSDRARIAVVNEEYALAVESARKAIQWDAMNYEAFRYLGWTLSDLAEMAPKGPDRDKLLSETVETFGKAIELFPQDRLLLVEMGWALDGIQQFEKADGYFRRAIEWDPNSPQVYFYYGAHFETAGDLKSAEEMFRKSQAMRPNPPAEMGLQRIEEARTAATPAPAP